MRLSLLICFFFSLFLHSCKTGTSDVSKDGPPEKPSLKEEIDFLTIDSIQIIGDLYTQDKSISTILLFHQGGSNARGEYRTIIPRLLENNFNIIAIDQRVGGQWYGEYNRTLANIKHITYGDPYGYCDAYNNLESTLDYLIDAGFTGPKILWGSSYSASLAIQLASRRGEDISGVLAFSPASGKPLEGCNPEQFFEAVTKPLLILKPPSETISENAQNQIGLAREFGHQVYLPTEGVHGSSMLVKVRVGHDVSETWAVVMEFLDQLN